MPTSPRMTFPYPAENTDPFYDSFVDFVTAVDQSAYASREDRHLILAATAEPAFDSGTSILSWAAAIKVLNAITGTVWTIPAGQVVVADGQIVYVNLVRAPSNSQDVVATVAGRVPADDNALAVAVRSGNTVYWRSGLKSGTAGNIPAGTQGAIPVWNNVAALTTVTPPGTGTSVLLGQNFANPSGLEFKQLKDWMPSSAQNDLFTRDGTGALTSVPPVMRVFTSTAALPAASTVSHTEAIVDTGGGTRHRYYSDGSTWTDLGIDMAFSQVLFGNTVTAANAGPYSVTSGHKLDIEIDGTPHVYTFVATTSYTATQLAALLVAAYSGLQADDNGSGHLRLGANTSIKVTGTTAVSDAAVFAFDTLKHIAYRQAGGALLYTSTSNFPAVDQTGITITYAPGDGTYRYMESNGAAWVEIGRISPAVIDAPTAATITSGIGPFTVSSGTHIAVHVNGNAADSVTLSGGAAVFTGAVPGGFALNGLSLTVTLNGGAPQTVTFTGAAVGLLSAAIEIQASITGAVCVSTGTAIRITSNLIGTDSAVVVAGTAANAAHLNCTGSATGTGNVNNLAAVTATSLASACSGFVFSTVSASGGRVVIQSKDTGVNQHLALASTNDAELGWDYADVWGTGDTCAEAESDIGGGAVHSLLALLTGGTLTFRVDGGAPQSWVIASGTAGYATGSNVIAFPINGTLTVTVDGVAYPCSTGGAVNNITDLVNALAPSLTGHAIVTNFAGAVQITSNTWGNGSVVTVAATGIGAALGFPGSAVAGTGTFINYDAVTGSQLSSGFNSQGFTGVTSDAVNGRFRIKTLSVLGEASTLYIDHTSTAKFSIRSTAANDTYYGSRKSLGDDLAPASVRNLSWSDDFLRNALDTDVWASSGTFAFTPDTTAIGGILRGGDGSISGRTGFVNTKNKVLTDLKQTGTVRVRAKAVKANTDYVIRVGLGSGSGSITFNGFSYDAGTDATHWYVGGVSSAARMYTTDTTTQHKGWMEFRIDVDPQANFAPLTPGRIRYYYNRRLIHIGVVTAGGLQVVLYGESVASGGLTFDVDYVEAQFARGN